MKVRCDCSKSLGDLLSNEEDIFLISNHEPDKWDFVRLTQAILDALTRFQRETDFIPRQSNYEIFSENFSEKSQCIKSTHIDGRSSIRSSCHGSFTWVIFSC